jgi:hypothetical protein
MMPILFIIGCCIPLILIGLVGSVPVLGELVVGVGFFLVLAVSFVLALIIIGAIGGLGIMYPTIAVEGSDTFDAFSRSYSYVYSRPWRTLFYTLITAIYGTLCFVFVKLVIGLVFGAASGVTGVFMNMDKANYALPLGKLQAMWFAPTLSGPFFGRFYTFPLSWSEQLASFFMAVWVFLVVGLVIAFAISFFFCGYTVIYLLLRKSVDTTEFEEVYVEEFESQIPKTPQAVNQEKSEPDSPAKSEDASSSGESSLPADTPTPSQGEENQT